MGGFLKWWYPTTIGFPTKKWPIWDVFGGAYHFRQHPKWFGDPRTLLKDRVKLLASDVFVESPFNGLVAFCSSVKALTNESQAIYGNTAQYLFQYVYTVHLDDDQNAKRRRQNMSIVWMETVVIVVSDRNIRFDFHTSCTPLTKIWRTGMSIVHGIT